MKKIYPFKFLDAYTKDDTGIFFGRDDEINSLYEMVFQTDVLLVYGASGTGKTSLIQCGLASRFQSHDWLALSIRRGNDLNESLENALKEACGDRSSESTKGTDWKSMVMKEVEDPESIKNLTPSEQSSRIWVSVRQEQLFLIKELNSFETLFRSVYLKYFRPIYLIFDQFEELFIIGSEEEQNEFINKVQEILKLDQPVKMIFSIREEYLGHLDKFEKVIPQLLKKKLRVEPMNFEKVSQVIRGATQFPNSNVRLKAVEEIQITEGIFDKLKGGQKSLTIDLPYLQVFLDKLYMNITKDDERQADAVFTLEALNKLGDIGDVLREFLEEQVKIISQNLIGKDSDTAEENIWKILSPFVTLEGTKEPMSKSILADRLPGINAKLIDTAIESFVNRRILRKSEEEDMYEIAHDSLALRIAEKRSAEENTLLEIVRIIKNQTFLKGEARELFSENKLNIIEPYLEKLREQKLIDEEGEDLIKQSRKKIEQEKNEREAAQKRELELANQRAKEEEELRKLAVVSEIKAKKRSRYAVIAAMIAFIVAGAALYFYYQAQRSEAEMRKQTEKSEKLIKSFYFWDDNLALASEMNKFSNEKRYGIIDKDGRAVVKYKYSAIDQFEYPGIAKVMRDSNYYLIDAKGREYKVANSLDGIRQGINALDLRGTAAGFSNEIFSRTQLKVLLLDGDAQTNYDDEMFAAISNLKNLSVLSLDNCNLKKLPNEFDKLKSLHSLGLSNNLLKNLPPEIGQMESLQNLYLNHNELNKLPPEISQLKSLQSLDLGYNKLNSLSPEIGQLTSLLKLVLDSNQLSSLPPEISNLKSLHILKLFDNQLTQLPPEIEQLDSLQILDLNGNQLKEFPDEIGQLGSLKILYLSKNKLSEFPDDVGLLGSLKELTLDENQLASLPSEIGELNSLQILNLAGNKITELPDEIGQLIFLQNLYLSENELNGLPNGIGKLNSLESMDLSYNKLESLPPEIGQMNSLQSLMLWNNQLTQLPPEIGQLNSLQMLGLNNNQLSNLPSEIGQLNSMIILSLYSNQLDSLPYGIGDLNSLKILILDTNKLAGLPADIGKMNSLQTLKLNQNQLTELPKEIGQLSSLIILDLKENHLKVLPDEIEQLKSLRRLDLIGNEISDAEQKRIKQLLPNCLILFSINDDEQKLRQELPEEIRQQLEDYEDYQRQLLEDFQLQQPEVNQLKTKYTQQQQPEVIQQTEVKQQLQPEHNREIPEVKKQQPEIKQRQPEVKPEQPKVIPAPPVVTPAPPVVTPAPPVVAPDPPVVTPEPSVVTPEPSVVIPPVLPVVVPAPPVVTPAPPVVTTQPKPEVKETSTSEFKNYTVKGGLKYEQLFPFSEFKTGYSFIGKGYLDFEIFTTFSFELGLGYGQYKIADTTTTVTGNNNPSSGFIKTEILPIDVRIKYTPWANTAKTLNPYFYLGAGIMHYSIIGGPDTSSVNSQGDVKDGGWAGIFPLGIGTEVLLSNNLQLDFNIGLTYNTTREYLIDNPYFLDGSGNIGLGITFGNFKKQ